MGFFSWLRKRTCDEELERELLKSRDSVETLDYKVERLTSQRDALIGDMIVLHKAHKKLLSIIQDWEFSEVQEKRGEILDVIVAACEVTNGWVEMNERLV